MNHPKAYSQNSITSLKYTVIKKRDRCTTVFCCLITNYSFRILLHIHNQRKLHSWMECVMRKCTGIQVSLKKQLTPVNIATKQWLITPISLILMLLYEWIAQCICFDKQPSRRYAYRWLITERLILMIANYYNQEMFAFSLGTHHDCVSKNNTCKRLASLSAGSSLVATRVDKR